MPANANPCSHTRGITTIALTVHIPLNDLLSITNVLLLSFLPHLFGHYRVLVDEVVCLISNLFMITFTLLFNGLVSLCVFFLHLNANLPLQKC